MIDVSRKKRRLFFTLVGVFALLLLAIAGFRACDAAPVTDSPLDIMAYCTTDDVLQAYDQSELAGITGDSQRSTVDESKVQDAIDDFGAYMEQHVRAQHPDNPFDTTNEFLNGLNVEGAFLTLQKRSPGGTDEETRQDLKRLDSVLMRIASGKLHLMDQAEIDDAPSDKLTPSDLIEQRPSGQEFGIHRRLPDHLST